MKITVINGAPNTKWSAYEDALKTSLDATQNNQTHYYTVRDMNIKPCIGCFGCWVKTPGKCVIQDDMEEVLSNIINSDIVIYATPLVAGFISSLTKVCMDRTIPEVLPYVRIFDGECHHPNRYESVADRAILIFEDNDTDAEDVALVYDYYDRVSLNLHSEKTHKHTATPKNMEEVINEIMRN